MRGLKERKFVKLTLATGKEGETTGSRRSLGIDG